MYSAEWFSTFSETISRENIDREVDALVELLPLPDYRRLLDIGCGVGRIAGPLASRGYSVTGIDVNVGALRRASSTAPGPTYVALDQRHVGRFNWQFDAVLVLWNSIGFVNRLVDQSVLAGLRQVLRPSGLLIMDMYHPDWLERNSDRLKAQRVGQAVVTRRWMSEGRLHNRIEYQGKHTDRIDFEVYRPGELISLLGTVGFEVVRSMVWWDESVSPSGEQARYQLLVRWGAPDPHGAPG